METTNLGNDSNILPLLFIAITSCSYFYLTYTYMSDKPYIYYTIVI